VSVIRNISIITFDIIFLIGLYFQNDVVMSVLAKMRFFRLFRILNAAKKMYYYYGISALCTVSYGLVAVILLAFKVPFGYDSTIVRE